MQQLIQRKSECIVTVPVTYHLLCKQRGTLPLFDISAKLFRHRPDRMPSGSPTGRKLTHPRSIALGASRPPTSPLCKSVKLIHTNKE